MLHFMIVLALYINLLNLSWIKMSFCLFLRNMEPSNLFFSILLPSDVQRNCKEGVFGDNYAIILSSSS